MNRYRSVDTRQTPAGPVEFSAATDEAAVERANEGLYGARVLSLHNVTDPEAVTRVA